MTQSVNNNLVFLAPFKRDLNHPMMTKMLQRAQLDRQKVELHTLDTARFIPAGSRVVLLGDEILRWATGEWDLFRFRGRLTHSGKLPNCLCMPTLLPNDMLPRHSDEDKKSPLKHKPARFQGIWVWDVNKLITAAGMPAKRPVTYFVDPSVVVWNQLVEQLLQPSDYPLSFDIETAYKMKMEDEEDFENDAEPGTILRISFSNHPDFSVSVSWGWPYLDGITRLLCSGVAKLGWNLNAFDIPRLEEEGINVDGEIYDGMDAWHMLRSEQPMGLEYVTSFYTDEQPWKHLSGSNPGLYSCKDADFALRNFIGIKTDLQSAGMWDLFMRHSVRLMPILRRAGKRGCLVDVDFSKSLEKEMQEKKDEYESIVQQYIPFELFPRKRYKKQQWDDGEGERLAIQSQPHSNLDAIKWENRTFLSVESQGKVKYCTKCGQEGVTKTVHLKGGKKNPCHGAEIKEKLGVVFEWDEILPFNLNSSDQVKAYIRHFKHEMGKNRKTDADSANGKHLKKLMGKYGKDHPFYEIKIEYAKVAKTISTYVYHKKMDANNVVHGWFNNSPTTWRLAQRAQNFTNVGKRETNPWAVRARNQLVARPGHCYVNADSTSIEAVIVGMLINDTNYIKMANKSIHAWLCCLELGIEFNDANVEMVKKNHKDLYNKFKVANYLLMYGGDPFLMHMEEPKTFPTKKDAENVRDKIFNLIPQLANWQDETRKRAKKEGVLTTPWGYRHYFYDVYTFARNKQGQLMFKDDGTPKIKLGQDSKTSLAFQPQNIAAGFGRETLLVIGDSEWGQYMCANTFVHDGYTLEPPFERRYECAQFLIDTLTRPVVELGNLRFGCEVEIGPEGGNWGDYHADKNPMGLKVWKKVEV